MVRKPCLAVGTKLIPGCFVFMSVSELLSVFITFSALTDMRNRVETRRPDRGVPSTSGEFVSPEHTISSFPSLYDC